MFKTTSREDLHSTHIIKDRQVLIIYTGGTIGMMKGKDGLTPKKNFLYDYMLNHPNLCDKDYTFKVSPKCKDFERHITSDNLKEHFLVTPESFTERRIFYTILEFEEIIDSSNMNLDYWKMIGRTIFKYYHEYDGFIVLHGTDTMNYTACVLSFMLENLNKPVILTGSQIPLIQMRNDALKNLVDALIIAGVYHIPEVTLMFDSKLFRGNRTIKSDNMGLKAFESPNLRPLVDIGINIKVNWDIILPPPTEELTYFEDIDSHITVIKFFPIIKDSTFASFFKPFVKAVIIETYGNGKLPRDRVEILSMIKEADGRGVILVNVTQCRKATSSDVEQSFLESCGVVNAGDMTVECCLAKLSYLLGKGFDQGRIKELFKESLRGEVSPFQRGVSIHSNRFVNALLNIIDEEKQNDENFIIASNLLPTIINELVQKDNLNLLKKLRNIIKQINFAKLNRKNPLHIACIEGNLDIAKFLLNCRININQVDEDKNTPLDYACMNKNKTLALHLKNCGAILNQDKDMGDYFCSLVYEDDLDTLKLFYLCGANLIVGDYDKRTPAHTAAALGRVGIVKFFIEETNLNIMVEDRWGHTPLHEAGEEIRKIIKSKYSCKTVSKKKQKRKLKISEFTEKREKNKEIENSINSEK